MLKMLTMMVINPTMAAKTAQKTQLLLLANILVLSAVEMFILTLSRIETFRFVMEND